MEPGNKIKSINWILVLTTSRREFDAACKHVTGLKKELLKGHKGQDLPFKVRIGSFEGHSVVIVCSLDSGNQRIQSAMNAALYQYNPGLVILIGVGGGIGDSVSIGSVVVSDHISDHTYSQEDGDTVSYKLKGGPIDSQLVMLAHEIKDDARWIDRIKPPKEESLEQMRQDVVVGMIGAGNVLLTGTTSPRAKLLEQSLSGIHTIEMESAGCYDLACTSKVLFITIRGISDRRMDKDPATDIYRQPWAAAHASAVAFELIHLFIAESKQMVVKILAAVTGVLPDSTSLVSSQTAINLLTDIPLTPRRASRGTLVAQLYEDLIRRGCLWLHGASGLGKTTLALMTATEFRQPGVFIDLRRCSFEEAEIRLLNVIRILETIQVVVLDDFPMQYSSQLLITLARFIAQARNRNIPVIITSSQPPPPEVETRLGRNTAEFLPVPYLTEEDVAELITQAGGDASIWAKSVHAFSAGGHPQLVDAKILGLSKRGWRSEELLPLEGESVEVLVQHDATYQRLMHELPKDARRLLCRLSLCLAPFDRSLAFAIASAAPEVDVPGEQLQYLIGPWIEARGKDHYVVSPLVKNAGTQNLSRLEQADTRNRLVLNLIARQPFPGEQLMHLFFLSFMEQNALGLSWFAGLMLQHMISDSEDFPLMSQQVSLFPLFCPDRPLFKADPFLSAMLRIVQFFVTLNTGNGNPNEVFDRAVGECRALPDKMLSSGLLLLLTVKLLVRRGCSVEAHKWLPLVLEFPTLLDESDDLGAGLRGLAADSSAISVKSPAAGYKAPEQFLFMLEATAIPNVDTLVELFDSLDQLTVEQRNHLLDGFDQDFPSTRLMISSPWSRQSKEGTLDGKAAAKQYEKLAAIAREWGHSAIEIQCCCAQIVMLDEYVGDSPKALSLAEEALAKHGANDDLMRRKQVVLFRQGKHAQSLESGFFAIPLQANDPERVFALRDAAISAYKVGKKEQSLQLFEQAADVSRQYKKTMPHLPAGLTGDCAIIEFENGEYVEALNLAKTALVEREKLDENVGDKKHFCSVILGLLATCMWHAAQLGREKQSVAGIEPGDCSDPFPSGKIVERQDVPTLVSWYFLALAEVELGVDAGVLAELRKRTSDINYVAFELMLTLAFIGVACKAVDDMRFLSALPLFLKFAGLAEQTELNDPLSVSQYPIEPLREEQWDNDQHIDYLTEMVLTFALSAVATDKAEKIDMLVQQLRDRLLQTSSIKPLLDMLVSDSKQIPMENFSRTIASCVALCHHGADGIPPKDALAITYYVWSWLRKARLKAYIENELADLFSKIWSRIINECSFLLSNSILAVPLIRLALEGKESGAAKLARLLLAADGSMSTFLGTDIRYELTEFLDTESAEPLAEN